MSFLQRVFTRGNRSTATPATQTRAERRDLLDVPGQLWNPAAIAAILDGGSSANAANEIVNDFSATSLSTVYTAVRILSTAIATLPCNLYKTALTGSKQLDVMNPLHRILTVEANRDTSAYTLWETLMVHVCFRGNGYLEISRDSAGTPTGLWNIDPRLTECVRLPDQSVGYRTTDGMKAGEFRIIPAKNAIHIQWQSWNGVVGQSPIACLREVIGLGLSQQKFQARLAVNNAIPSAVLTVPGTLSPEDRARAREDWNVLQTGANTKRMAILDEGYKLEPLGMSSQDAELLASRKFTRDEIAAAYMIPTFMLGDSEKMTHGNAVQLSLSFVQNTLMPICKQIETELKRKLIPVGSPAHIAFDLRERLRGDFATTMTAYSTGRQNGFYSVNDVRRELGEDPIGPEGDVYTVGVNMTNLSNLLIPGFNAPQVDTGDGDGDENSGPTAIRSATAIAEAAHSVIGKKMTALDAVASLLNPLAERISRRVGAPIDKQRMVDHMTRLESRSRQWNADSVQDVETILSAEVKKATKAFTFAAYESRAKQELELSA